MHGKSDIVFQVPRGDRGGPVALARHVIHARNGGPAQVDVLAALDATQGSDLGRQGERRQVVLVVIGVVVGSVVVGVEVVGAVVLPAGGDAYRRTQMVE